MHSPDTLAVSDGRVVIGDWSADIGEVIAVSARLRGLLREGRVTEAREMLNSMCREEQAALVAVDADPEEILSLTAMDEKGSPGYLAEVVDRLPSSLLAELLVPRGAKWDRFNTGLLASMSETTFRRTVADTLDPVYFHGRRGAVSWEWLEIVAALQEVDRIASLLQAVDEEVLEDALIPHIDRFAMNETVFPGVSAFRTVSESGGGLMLPPLDAPEKEEVIHALHAAAPELLARVIRNAWERAGGMQP
ncbi:MAG: hypothetical protein OXH50_20440 [Gemmatimonadetes bacterium]|nr:hypothetical protein [Gemmatimonadota bacterium]